MGTVFIIFLYVLLIVGALSSILTFVVLLSFVNIVMNLNERLAQLIEILFVLGEQRAAVDTTIERVPGRGKGLQDVPNPGAPYDPRYATQAQVSPQMKWGETEPGKTWDENL